MDFDKLDNAVNLLLPAIESYQADYIKSAPKYFEGLPTHSVVPTKETLADKLNQKRDGKETTWNDTGLLPATLPFSVEVNEYVAPGDNKGWSVSFRVSDGEKTFLKTFGYGVEAEARTHDWKKYPNFPL